jgi:hypothetical protein
MTIQDAWNILKGGNGSATNYLKQKTTSALTAKFRPVVTNALNQVSATIYWTDLAITYNKIPFVTPVNTDLQGYVTGKAVDGLFILVTDEENKIRQDPMARTSELLKKVFGYKGQ